jgi:type IV secretory pathway VirJ component
VTNPDRDGAPAKYATPGLAARMHRAATTVILAVSLAGAALTTARPVAAQSVGDLPLSIMPASPGPLLAVLMTGDGGWAAGDRSMAQALAQRGIAVVGLNSARYLELARTPDQASSDLARIMGHFLEAWHRERVVLVGYSRGADLLPFMMSRLPADLRDKIVLTALLGPGQWASFEFSLLDVARSHARPNAFPVQPEVAKLRGSPIVCLYGSKDHGAICESLAGAGLARAIEHPGGHRVSGGDGPALVATIVDALPKRD